MVDLKWKPEAIAEWKRDLAAAEKELETAAPYRVNAIKGRIKDIKGYIAFLENGPSISEVKS